jgi:hypothetical protein
MMIVSHLIWYLAGIYIFAVPDGGLSLYDDTHRNFNSPDSFNDQMT